MSYGIRSRLLAAGEWLVLLPLWRRLISTERAQKRAAAATGAVWAALAIALLVVAAADDEQSDGQLSSAAAERSATPRRTARPTRSGTTSSSPSPHAPSPTPPDTAELTGEPAPAATGGTAPGGGSAPTGAPPPAAPAAVLTVVTSSSYTDSSGDVHVVGEVRNNGPDFMDFVEITGTFFDGAGQVVTSEYTYTHADIVGPGETAAFDLVLLDGSGLGVSRHELVVHGEVTADRPAAGLVIQGDSAGIDAAGDYVVSGQVVNQSGGAVEFVKVIGTFYDSAGTVVRSDFTYTELDEIPPGGTDTFELIIAEGGSAGIATYSLRIEGFPV